MDIKNIKSPDFLKKMTISELENAVFTDNKESIKTISTKILKMVAERNIKLKNQQ